MTEITPKARALIVHDDMDMRHSLALSMRHAGYDVDFAETPHEALEKAREIAPTVFITDLHMPGMSDMSMLHEIRRVAPNMSILVLTAVSGIAPAVEAVRVVADEYVTKPVDPHALHFAVERAVKRNNDRAETELLRRALVERHQAHTALLAERNFVSTVLATIDSLVVVLDVEGRIVHFNAACERATGYTETEVHGRNVLEFFIEADEFRDVKRVFNELRTAQTKRNTHENYWRTKSGERRRISWTNSVLFDDQKSVLHIVASGVDITDVRAMEMRVRRSEHLASIATFSAGVAHEIKNPLNAAMLHLQLLTRLSGKSSPDIEAIREAGGIAMTEIRRVSGLLEEFLLFARPAKPQRSLTDLRRICDDVVALCRLEAEALQIELSVAGDSALSIRADDARIRQVVLNLVRNAIEALRSKGHVHLEVSRTDEVAKIRVEDDGPGLQADEVRIFQPFFTTKEKGTGLGLSITHRIVTDHGGDITVESQPGKTVFTVILPGEDGENAGSSSSHPMQ